MELRVQLGRVLVVGRKDDPGWRSVPSGLDKPDLMSDILPLAVRLIGSLAVARRATCLARAVVRSPLGGTTLLALLEHP